MYDLLRITKLKKTAHKILSINLRKFKKFKLISQGLFTLLSEK